MVEPLNNRGLAEVAATSQYVLVADRTATDSGDLFRCLDAATGNERWQLTYPTSGTTKDYGNVPAQRPWCSAARSSPSVAWVI